MLAIVFGILVGLSLGLTGGGGSILAVPMLVHGLGMDAKHAAGVSLAAVGATALVGALERISRREIDLKLGFLFAICGMVGAPVGVVLRKPIPGQLLLALFSVLMVIVAIRMWIRAGRSISEPAVDRSQRRTNFPLMAVLGMLTGILSGVFGVGGGFIIVPALVLASGMPIHRAVATSLLVIPLTSAAGIVAEVVSRNVIDWRITALFVAGGISGMVAGTAIYRKLPAPLLQKAFAVVIVLVAVFNGFATLYWHR